MGDVKQKTGFEDKERHEGSLRFNMLYAKTHLSRLVEAVETGDEKEVVIARNVRPIAKLVAFSKKRGGIKIGLAEGKYPPFNKEAFDDLDAQIEADFHGSPIEPSY
jgi:antitoxin (DNA-binding transcriptional repressor) of toxin-antitoxin stability system